MKQLECKRKFWNNTNAYRVFNHKQILNKVIAYARQLILKFSCTSTRQMLQDARNKSGPSGLVTTKHIRTQRNEVTFMSVKLAREQENNKDSERWPQDKERKWRGDGKFYPYNT
jgi:hypothetical protein